MTTKLTLSKETLRALDGAEAQCAHGGAPNTFQTCATTCNTALLRSMCICLYSYRVGCPTTDWAK